MTKRVRKQELELLRWIILTNLDKSLIYKTSELDMIKEDSQGVRTERQPR